MLQSCPPPYPPGPTHLLWQIQGWRRPSQGETLILLGLAGALIGAGIAFVVHGVPHSVTTKLSELSDGWLTLTRLGLTPLIFCAVRYVATRVSRRRPLLPDSSVESLDAFRARMGEQPGDTRLKLRGMEAIRTLAEEDGVHRHRLVALVPWVVHAMREGLLVPEVAIAGCSVLLELARDPDNRESMVYDRDWGNLGGGGGAAGGGAAAAAAGGGVGGGGGGIHGSALVKLLWDVSLRHMSVPAVCNIVLQCVGELVQNPDTHGALLGVACKLVLEVGTRGPRVASTQGHAVACVGHMLRVATRVNQVCVCVRVFVVCSWCVPMLVVCTRV